MARLHLSGSVCITLHVKDRATVIKCSPRICLQKIDLNSILLLLHESLNQNVKVRSDLRNFTEGDEINHQSDKWVVCP